MSDLCDEWDDSSSIDQEQPCELAVDAQEESSEYIGEVSDYLDEMSAPLLEEVDGVPGCPSTSFCMSQNEKILDEDAFRADSYAELRSESAGLNEVEDYFEELELSR